MTRLLALLISLLSPLAALAAQPTPVRVGFLVVDGVYNSELIAPYDIFHHTVSHTDPGMDVLVVPSAKASSSPASIDCTGDGDALQETPATVQHQDGTELHQFWLLADHADLWSAAAAEPSSLERFRRRVLEVIDDTSPLGLIRKNREMYPWLEREHPAVGKINRMIEGGAVGRHRPMTCLEAQILGFQASRLPLFEQPSEIVALILRRGEGSAGEVKVYIVADDDDTTPKPTYALEAMTADLSQGWRLWDTFHNHTFELEERGHLAVAAPSSSDLGVFAFLRDRFGLERATVSDGFNTLELDASEFETLARAIEPKPDEPAMLAASSPVSEPILPPTLAWNGKTRGLVVPPEDEWATPSEKTALTRTPRYDETFEWLRRLVAAAPELEMISLGKSGEGRDVWMVVASLDGSTPAKLAQGGKPVLLAHAGIHSGEIDGKDAGLMLLRDMTVRATRRNLLERANFVFIPILNVDGHERFSAHNRMNQRGPVEMGWRTNRRNLNLNRDFAKLDTPEVRALVTAINTWRPDLYLDLHVTDGADYQYDITFGYNGAHAWSPAIARWLDGHLTPALTRDLEALGHIPGPLILTANGRDLSEGFLDWTAGPRFSNGFGDARHLPTVLVENHSLKPYDQRVLGTYALLESTLRTLGDHFESLRHAVESDKRAKPKELALGWKPGGEPRTVSFKAIDSELEDSAVTGDQVVRWTGKPKLIETAVIPFEEPVAKARRPAAYYIPAAWNEIAHRLVLHGIEVEELEDERAVAVEMYRLPEAKLAPGNNLFRSQNPFEGHARVEPGKVVAEHRELTLPAGSFRVSTDQPLGDLAMLLLEPLSPDSFFQWGFLLEILNRTEYFEPYVMEPMAQRMLDEDPALAEAFQEKLSADKEFADNPRRRLGWFYEKTPFFDDEYRLYPIARER